MRIARAAVLTKNAIIMRKPGERGKENGDNMQEFLRQEEACASAGIGEPLSL
jgi:hypothetical protein